MPRSSSLLSSSMERKLRPTIPFKESAYGDTDDSARLPIRGLTTAPLCNICFIDCIIGLD